MNNPSGARTAERRRQGWPRRLRCHDTVASPVARRVRRHRGAAGGLQRRGAARHHARVLDHRQRRRGGDAVAAGIRARTSGHPGGRAADPADRVARKIADRLRGGSLPDVTQLGDTWIPEFAALHALEPLQSRVEHSAVIRKDDYFASVWATSVIDKVLVGIPWYVDTRLLFYRTDLLRAAGFDAPPRDWAEWQAQMDAIRAHSGGRRWGALLPVNEYDQLLALA